MIALKQLRVIALPCPRNRQILDANCWELEALRERLEKMHRVAA